MGPIQSGVNQLVNTALRSSFGMTIAKEMKKQSGLQEKMMKQNIDKAVDSAKEGDINTHLESVNEILKDPKKAQKYSKKHPEEFERLIGPEVQGPIDDYLQDTLDQMKSFLDKSGHNVDENKELNIGELEKTLARLEGRSQNNKRSFLRDPRVGISNAQEAINNRIQNRTAFDNMKKAVYDRGMIPSSINKKIKSSVKDGDR